MTLGGLPDPRTIVKGGAITTAPVGGRRSRLVDSFNDSKIMLELSSETGMAADCTGKRLIGSSSGGRNNSSRDLAHRLGYSEAD